MTRTITNPANNSALVSETIRTELQTLETEISDVSTGHDHDGANSKSIPATSIANGSVSNTEFQYIGTLTSDVQTQLDAKVSKATYDANSILYATTDNTPVALTVGASTIVGRKATGDIVALSKSEAQTVLNVADGATANTKAAGSDITTGTDDAKFLTSKALADATVGKFGSAWVSYNPTPTNFVVGSGQLVAAYSQIGKTVHVRAKFLFGSGSSVSGAMSISLPVTSISYAGTALTQIIGNATFLDSGTAVYYGYVVWASTTTATIQVSVVSGTYAGSGGTSSTVPMTWATNDEFYMDFIYEAA